MLCGSLADLLCGDNRPEAEPSDPAALARYYDHDDRSYSLLCAPACTPTSPYELYPNLSCFNEWAKDNPVQVAVTHRPIRRRTQQQAAVPVPMPAATAVGVQQAPAVDDDSFSVDEEDVLVYF